jgi:hypothetical protein
MKKEMFTSVALKGKSTIAYFLGVEHIVQTRLF